MTLTDGEENNSIHYTRDDVRYKIQFKKDNDNWKFVYLGANQDSFKVGENMAYNNMSTQNYQASDEGICSVMRNVSMAVDNYCREESQEVVLTQNDVSQTDASLECSQ